MCKVPLGIVGNAASENPQSRLTSNMVVKLALDLYILSRRSWRAANILFAFQLTMADRGKRITLTDWASYGVPVIFAQGRRVLMYPIRTGEGWSERLDSNQRPPDPQENRRGGI
jgi:hypothetical protein